jgi:hypothetical protein
MKVRNHAIPLLLLLLLPIHIAAQKRPRPKPRLTTPVPAAPKFPVVVTLIEGDPIKGMFLQADAETVLVEVPSGRLSISIRKIANLQFANEAPEPKEAETDQPTEEDQYQPAARKARAELRKLVEAAQIKLAEGEYGRLLIEVKPVIEEIAAGLPECPLKSDMLRAIDVYTDAGRAMGAADRFGHIPVASEPGATLMRKYNLRPELNRLASPDHLLLDPTLTTIWNRAAYFYNSISSYIR